MICTDSKSVIQAIIDTKQSAHKHEFIVDIRQKITAAMKHNKEYAVELVWVSAHVEIIHNEKVDEYAKEATRRGTTHSNKRYMCKSQIGAR